MEKIKRALISVSDKTGIAEFARKLISYGWEIISTGGTKSVLEAAGMNIIDIISITKNPEAFGGRMKTISFNIESALLFDRVKDREEAKRLNIFPIDLVVCNLYPFAEVKKRNGSPEELIENIDIGGPTMIRAAAKNYKFVTVITDIKDYDSGLSNLASNKGIFSPEFRKIMMRKAFNYTADYDALIATAMDELGGEKSLRFSFEKGKELRYGENSHQKAYLFRDRESENSLYDMEVLQGKELSYNNIVDIESAISAVSSLMGHGCAIVKHTNTCGFSEGQDQLQVFKKAWKGDPLSAFGSIIAFNSPLEDDTVRFLNFDNPNKKERKFVEVIIAPEFPQSTLNYLKKRKNLRVIRFPVKDYKSEENYKILGNCLLSQNSDNLLYDGLRNVTASIYPIQDNLKLLEFGIKAMRNIKSNAIIIVRKIGNDLFQLLGMGCGQPNRVNSVKLAIKQAKDNLFREYEGDNFDKYYTQEIGKAILCSDAFFPFSDSIDLASENGIKIIVQPGGSIKDKLVIKRCEELKISMIFTGIRHFKH